jgi:hypothetical protein
MFGANKNKNEKKLSSFTYSFRFDDNYLYFNGIGADGFRILKRDIESVSIDANPEKGMLKSTLRLLKINGHGTFLGQAKINMGFAEKAQDFILEELKINKKKTSQESSNNLDDLEKLAVLKDKGIISQEEFDIKKKQILNVG